MTRNEHLLRNSNIDDALTTAGWTWQAQVQIAPGQISMSGSTVYDDMRAITVDYLLRFQGIPLAIVDVKNKEKSAADGIQQASRYASRLSLRYSVATNGIDWVLKDNETGELESLTSPPEPETLLRRMEFPLNRERWEQVFQADYPFVQRMRPYQEIAVNKVLLHFAQGHRRAGIIMATGTGKTQVILHLVRKMLTGKVISGNRVLFITDRAARLEELRFIFEQFPDINSVVLNREMMISADEDAVHLATVQMLVNQHDGREYFRDLPPDSFGLIIIDDSTGPGFSRGLPVLKHFANAMQLGVSSFPGSYRRSLAETGASTTQAEWFGNPVFIYGGMQAIDEGFLAPYRMVIRQLDTVYARSFSHTFTNPQSYDVRSPDYIRIIADDFWTLLSQEGRTNEKTIIFCADSTQAEFMVRELGHLSGDPGYAVRITGYDENRNQLVQKFIVAASHSPRAAVTVDFLTSGPPVPDVRNLVFMRPVHSETLYQKMKACGAHLSIASDKRFYTIYDYTGVHRLDERGTALESAENWTLQSDERHSRSFLSVGAGFSVETDLDGKGHVHIPDGQKIPSDTYVNDCRRGILTLCHNNKGTLYAQWVNRGQRQYLRENLRSNNISAEVLRVILNLPDVDDVDIYAKVGFQLDWVPDRVERVESLWDKGMSWLENEGSTASIKLQVWQTALDHYCLFGIDDLENAQIYMTPPFTQQFGSFPEMARRYGGAARLREDFEKIKELLYTSELH